MDKVGSEIRSRIMAAVRSKGSRSTEKRLRAYLIRNGIRGWRINPRDVPGHPDFVFYERKVAIFVDGCFWHGCPQHCRMPHSREDYWTQKIQGNNARDLRVNHELEIAGWLVIRLWEHEIKEDVNHFLSRIMESIR